MPLKKTVAMERRIDLASLFCLIARHGPAVLLTLVVIGCSLAGFIMFRNMREKRRRRRREAGADRRDGHAGHGDAALGLGEEDEPCADEEVSRRGSTDASDDEHGYRSHVRQRRAATDRNPYKDKLPDGDTAVDKAPYSFFWHRYPPKATESHAEETRYTERNFSHTSAEDVAEEVCGSKEPGLINDVGYEEKEKVIEADSSEEITSTTEDVSDEEFTQEEEALQFTFNSQLCSAPTPTLGASDSKEKSEETNMKQEHELENSVAPVLTQGEVSSAPLIEDQVVTLDQVHSASEQNLSLQSGEPAAVPHFNYEQQADISCNDNTVSTTFSVQVMGDDLVEASHNETCESEPFKLEDTKDDCSPASTTAVNIVVADLSSNTPQQSEPSVSPTLDAEIDQNGLCPQELSHVESDAGKSFNQKDTGLVKTECSGATSDDGNNTSNLEAVSHSLDVNTAESKSLDHQVAIDKVETETSLLSENTVQNRECHEILPHVQDLNQAHTDNFSGQKDNIHDGQQTLPVYKENNLKTLDHDEDQSSHVDFKHEECLAHPPVPQSQLCEVMEEETSLSGLTADVKEEISTVTDATVQTNNQKLLEGTPELDTETILSKLPSQISGNESNQTCQKDESMDTTNISATTRDKIESMVEQMVAEVYKDVTQTALEANPMQVEENNFSELARDNDPDNLAGKEVEVKREVVVSSNMAGQSTEEIVNSVSCLNNITKVEDEVQKDVCVASDASENKYPNASSNNDGSTIPVTEAVPNPQDTNHLEEERVEHLDMDKNVENEISVPEDTHLAEQMAIEVKSTHLEQNISLEYVDELIVQPVLDINGTVGDNLTNEPIVKVVEQETRAEDVCFNMATQMQAETTVEVSNIEKVEDEKEIQSGIEGETVETIATSIEFGIQSEQKESEVLLDIGKGLSKKAEFEIESLLLEKEKSVQEIPSVIIAEVTENTATLSDVQSEQKEPGMLLDASNNLSNVTVKSSKVVIVCRTLEASVSAVEMSDSEEDVVNGETTYLELTSSKSSACQDHIDINRNPANEEARADVVVRSSGTLAAQTVIKEMATEEEQLTETGKPFDLTSRVVLDIPQDSSTSMESTEQIEQKDPASTPSLESGISSMTASPEKEESSKVIGQDALTTCQVYAEEKVSRSVFASDGFVTVTKEESVTMEMGPQTSSFLQMSALREISDELSMTNEDLFGGEIEDGYHKAMEEFMAQVVNNIKSTSEEVTKETVKKLDEKREQASVANKENGEKVDSEKTEISIMEATMDHNEWITDGNYQVLPWMTTASFSKDSISTNAVKDVAENNPQTQTSSTEESVENAKKVLAVQPMPQNTNVTFRVHYVTLSPYQTVAVTGDQPELGAWKSVVPLEKTKDGYWTCVVSLPAESHVEWKFVVLEKGEVCRWEECGNRLLYTGYGDDLLVHKWWGFL